MSAALLAGFLARERRPANPVIDPALFRDRRFTWGTAATVAVAVGLRNPRNLMERPVQGVLLETGRLVLRHFAAIG